MKNTSEFTNIKIENNDQLVDAIFTDGNNWEVWTSSTGLVHVIDFKNKVALNLSVEFSQTVDMNEVRNLVSLA